MAPPPTHQHQPAAPPPAIRSRPWRFTNRTGKVAPEHRRLDRYSTLDLQAIKALPVEDIVAKNAHLYLWVPNALLPEGLSVMDAWGSATSQMLFGPSDVKTAALMAEALASISET